MIRLGFALVMAAIVLCTASLAQERSRGPAKTLIVFFSKTGNTRVFAEQIEALVGGDMFEVVPKNPYPAEYRPTTEIAREEQDKNARPAIAATMTPEQMAQYDTIFIGYPIWWGTMPMVMFTFLEQFEYTGKTVVPFCTNGGSGIGRSPADIATICKGATVLQGLALRTGAVQQSGDQITSWLQQLNLL